MIRTITEWIFPAKKAARLKKEQAYRDSVADNIEAILRSENWEKLKAMHVASRQDGEKAKKTPPLTAKNAVLRGRQLQDASIGSRTTAPVDSSSNDLTNALLLNSLMSSPSAPEPAREVAGHGGSFDGAGASADWSSCSSSSDSSSSYSSDSSSSDSSSSCSSGD